MKPFTIHRGRVAPIYRANIDTDQIIPKQFLKRIERTGFGEFLFNDWRKSPEGLPNPDFVLNQPKYSGGSILVADKTSAAVLRASTRYGHWRISVFAP